MAKAYLVTYEIQVRILSAFDSPDEDQEGQIYENAKRKILTYTDCICNENVVDFKEDKECPFGTFKTDYV